MLCQKYFQHLPPSLSLSLSLSIYIYIYIYIHIHTYKCVCACAKKRPWPNYSGSKEGSPSSNQGVKGEEGKRLEVYNQELHNVFESLGFQIKWRKHLLLLKQINYSWIQEVQDNFLYLQHFNPSKTPLLCSFQIYQHRQREAFTPVQFFSNAP